ncbi:MAG TPA: hypothetical protein DF613_02015, partial [Lachnospiraceae bacterium]|nr:hypothetical protein [Lachnospiraceae bacterium]
MDKKTAVREAILSVEKNGVELKEGNHYPVKRLIPGKSAEKPHRIALATFARGCAPEDEVLLVDITLTGSGKKGVLFSTDAIYSSKGLLTLRGVPMPLRYGELESVGADEDKWDELILHYRDGRTIKTLTTPYTCYYYAIISAALRALVPEQTAGTEEPAPEPESPSEPVPVAEPEMMPASEPVPVAEPEIMPVSEPASVAEPKIIPAPEVVPVQEPEPVTGSEQASVSETETAYVPAPEWEFGSEPETASEIKPEPQQAPALSAQEMLDLAQACSGRKDFAGALRWYGAALDSGKLSEQAVPVVQYTCGLICCMKENPDARPENGLSWFEKAARGGYAKAQY